MNKHLMRLGTMSLVTLILGISPPAKGGGGQTSSAILSMGQGMLGAGMNYYTGKQFMALCRPPKSQKWACPLGVMSYAQAGVAALSTLEALATKNAADSNYTGGGDMKIPPLESFNDLDDLGNYLSQNKELLNKAKQDPNLPSDFRHAFKDTDLVNSIKDLTGKGYNMDLKTGQVKHPNGQITSSEQLSALGGDDGLKGLPPDALAKIKSKAALIKKILDKHSGGNQGKGNRIVLKGNRPSSRRLNSSFDMDYKNPFAHWNTQKKRKPASIKGLTKIVNGEPIGVAGDNIFDMITRRYSEMNKKNMFINE